MEEEKKLDGWWWEEQSTVFSTSSLLFFVFSYFWSSFLYLAHNWQSQSSAEEVIIRRACDVFGQLAAIRRTGWLRHESVGVNAERSDKEIRRKKSLFLQACQSKSFAQAVCKP